MECPFLITCKRPFLVADFPETQTMLSWAMTRPGFQLCRQVAWLEVRNADLPPGLDPFAFLETRMAAAGHADAVALMTSRDVTHHHLGHALAGDVAATCLATVGLSNAECVGAPRGATAALGTINLLVHISCALSEAALIETISIATQARTAAILALDLRINGSAVSGTGTDCIVAAAPAAGEPARFAGLHTSIGEAVGAAVYTAVRAGGALWCRQKASGFFATPHNPQLDHTAC
ncbi:MAG: adenosylcobinamide amidohydrolase [Sphingobium sp.]